MWSRYLKASIVHPLRRSIAWRLALGLGAVVLTMGLVSTVSTVWFADMARRINLTELDECKARGVAQLAGVLRDQSAYVKRTIITENLSYEAGFRAAATELRARAEVVRGLPGLPEADASIDEILAASERLERLYETRLLPLVRARDHASLAKFDDQIVRLAVMAQKAQALALKQEEQKEDLSRSIRAEQRRVVVVSILAQILALGMALLTGALLYRSLARPIATLATGTARVAAGDLETEIQVDREDELGQLARGFNEMTRAVRDNQSKLLQAERLAGLGRMAASVAHEINNPIAVIVGYARLLRTRNGAPSEMLATIEEEAERCHQVVEGLLDLTRNSVHPVRSTTVDLRALAEQAAGCSWVSGRAPDVSIEIAGAGTTVGNETKLRQVLVNLLANAVESCGDRGRVTVSIEAPRACAVQVSVSDTGPGVDPGHGGRLFDPFFTTKQHGTGLGLAISRAIARAHGGDLVLGSDRGGGATFELTLPATEQATS